MTFDGVRIPLPSVNKGLRLRFILLAADVVVNLKITPL
jgi:hypothetical protein